MKKATAFLFITLCVGCGGDVTSPPTTTTATHEPDAVSLSLKPDADEYLYELIIEQRAVGTQTVMSILEMEIKATATRFDSGRVRFEFEVVRANATTGPTRERQRPDPQRAAAVRSLRWSSKHGPDGVVVDLATTADAEWILEMLGARSGLFGIVYPTEPVQPERPWRATKEGAEWKLSYAADWLATLEGAITTTPTPDAPERSQSVRARIQLDTGMPIEMVGDEAVTRPDAEWDSILRHWTLSLIG
ncbi:MAG: hypothetical protein AB1725_03840 [Armatimonadota bacterium]